MIKIITAKEAYNILKNKFQGLNIFSVIDYDSNKYVFGASENYEIGYNTMYYSVNKRTRTIQRFNPMDDLDLFSDAIDNKSIDINLLKEDIK